MSAQAKPYMSIGEVLKTLSEEFPDVSISKIRFLETEGLIETERTPSGYRKFYPADVARLRYILRLQRDHFVPLKVIRKRMEHFDPAEVEAPPPPAALQAVPPIPDTAPPTTGAPTGHPEVASSPAAAPPAAVQAPASAPASGPLASPDDDFIHFDGGMTLSFEELRTASGLEADRLRELEEYGLIDSHPLDAGGIYYDEDDLVIAKIAKDFAKFGFDARHLKMYKVFAAKEAGLFEQIVAPHTSSTDRRKQAVQSLAELARLSKRLKHLLLKAGLREHLQ